MSMCHPNTERLIDYWQSRALDGAPPPRTSISPADFADLLPQVVMLGRVCSGIYPIRLAGALVGDLHQRDLRQQNALSLFSARDRMDLQTALEMARRRPEPIVVTTKAHAEGVAIGMEILFAPLAGPEEGPDRFLCLYQPLTMVARLKGQPLLSFSLVDIRKGGVANEAAPRLRLAAIDGRRIA
jgi:hypothetical protein